MLYNVTGLVFMKIHVLDEVLKRLERHSRFYQGEGSRLWWERFSAYRRYRRVATMRRVIVDHLPLNRAVLFWADNDNSLKVIR